MPTFEFTLLDEGGNERAHRVLFDEWQEVVVLGWKAGVHTVPRYPETTIRLVQGGSIVLEFRPEQVKSVVPLEETKNAWELPPDLRELIKVAEQHVRPIGTPVVA